MEEDKALKPIKALIADLKRQLGEKDELLRSARQTIGELRKIISMREQVIGDRDERIVSIQKLQEWHQTINQHEWEGKGNLELHWQESYRRLYSAYINQGKELKIFKQAVAGEDGGGQVDFLRKMVSDHAKIVEGKDQIIAQKNHIIAKKDFLLLSADPKVFPCFENVEVGGLRRFSYSADRVFAEIEFESKVKEVQVDVVGRTINGHVIKLLVDQIVRIHEDYTTVNATCHDQMKMELTKKPIYEIGLRARAREMEYAFAARTCSIPRERITHSGNLVPPEIALKYGDIWNNSSYFVKVIQLLEFFRDLKIWNREGIVGCRYAALRNRVAGLIHRVYPLEEFHNGEEFDADEAATKEFDELWEVCRELRDGHKAYRKELISSRRNSREDSREIDRESLILSKTDSRGKLEKFRENFPLFRRGSKE
ncbi:hypothetical protein SBOR_3637 [Sclerotinia borealis F-4128]|uniref:Uncharacterized protein n=1 Tax=Sclerotinia borealis (strain F-4128) TaxID=1432307 RepID=W9CN72_SCLBF|nr:hypothetical protein SBOR_3637 [Sclerotinia borealis F-4128]